MIGRRAGAALGVLAVIAATAAACTPVVAATGADLAPAAATLPSPAVPSPAAAAEPSPTSVPSPVAAAEPSPPPATDPTADPAATLPADLTLAWTRNHLPEGYAAAVAAEPAVGAVTVVRGATRGLVRTAAADGSVVDDLPPGWRYPLEVLAIDPTSYAAVTSHPEFAGLQPDEAVLTVSSAEVRRLGVGGHLTFVGGAVLRVVAVVPDAVAGAAEVVVARTSPIAPRTEKYLLARPATPGARLGGVLERLVPDARPVRVLRAGDTPVLRHADAVLAPAQIKVRYGEFAMKDTDGREFLEGLSFEEGELVNTTVPLLGRVMCNRAIIAPLVAAMTELQRRGLSDLVDPDDFAGCWSARTQSTDGPLSSHAWGIAVDINARANTQGGPSHQDPRLVEVMARYGFTWGGDWLLPDPMHFEASGRLTP